ncbi:MAG: O-antigen ligase family protein, partial [bacterium]|nr:O-antigen ligase family protein [bacterium]
PVSVEPFLTEAELLRMGSLVAAFFLASQLFSHRREIRLAGYTITAIGVVLSFFAVYQQARWGTLLYGKYPVPSATPYGPFVNHNHFAGFVEMCALVALGGTIGHLRRQTTVPIILLGGSAAIMGVALVLSHSRGGLLAAAAGAGFLGAVVLRKTSRAPAAILTAWGGAVVFLLLLAAPRSVFERISTIAGPGQDVSIEFRLQLWRDSLDLAARSPVIGTGLGTYIAAIPAFRTDLDETRAEYAESDWIQHACETG